MKNNHLKRLTIFAQVIRHGSFTGAAKKLALPRSSVSEQIKQLESNLGIRLLQRTTRTLALTPEGQAVYARAESIQALVDEIECLAFDQTPSGEVTISLTQDIAQSWLIPNLIGFYKTHPDIAVNIMANDSLSDLVDERIDLALRVTVEGSDSTLIGRSLGSERLKLFASPSYLSQVGTPQSLDDLKECRWIMLQQISPRGNISLYNGDVMEKIKPLNVYESNSPELQRCMLEHAMGIGLHLPSLANRSVEKGVLQPIMPEYFSTSYNISLVYPSRELPPRTRTLLEFLVQAGWPSHSLQTD